MGNTPEGGAVDSISSRSLYGVLKVKKNNHKCFEDDRKKESLGLVILYIKNINIYIPPPEVNIKVVILCC